MPEQCTVPIVSKSIGITVHISEYSLINRTNNRQVINYALILRLDRVWNSWSSKIIRFGSVRFGSVSTDYTDLCQMKLYIVPRTGSAKTISKFVSEVEWKKKLIMTMFLLEGLTW